ncbi:unnamed protein product [Paramecium primaurelia]|uniref:Uncharacterized protein n=2 Tax=Paramecium TaxID=5884 RepID=A0A8S1XNG7_9CILI|nr:unnamed protein product [Paramecium primaurelia]CAD8202204.1 unnamed protein product [Paramecium pentaurelia]
MDNQLNRSNTVNIDISSYKIASTLDTIKESQLERKRNRSKRRFHAASFHIGKDVQNNQEKGEKQRQEDHSLDQIRRNYVQKMKAFPKIDAYKHLKGYLQLQDQEVKRIKNNTNQLSFGTLYPQNEQEENQLSNFLVGTSPIRRNYSNNRYVSESPARFLHNQAIPNLDEYLKDRKARKLIRQTITKKEQLEQQIQDLENKKFKLHEKTQDPRNLSLNELIEKQVHKYIPYKFDAKVDTRKLNTEKIIKSTEEVPMTMLKEKLLTDNIKTNGEMFSSINPLQLQLYSITDKILQFHKSKQKFNSDMIKSLQKSDHNRRQTLFHKHMVYHQEQQYASSQKDLFYVQQELIANLNQRINYNENLTKKFQKLITILRDGQIELEDDDLSILNDLRYIILKGRNLSDEDFLELLRLRNFTISLSCLELIVNHLFPNSKNDIIKEYNENHC